MASARIATDSRKSPMEHAAGCTHSQNCHRQSRSRALRPRRRRRLAKGRPVRAAQIQTGLRRKYFAGRAVRAIRWRPGGHSGNVAHIRSRHEIRQVLGNSARSLPASRTSAFFLSVQIFLPALFCIDIWNYVDALQCIRVEAEANCDSPAAAIIFIRHQVI